MISRKKDIKAELQKLPLISRKNPDLHSVSAIEKIFYRKCCNFLDSFLPLKMFSWKKIARFLFDNNQLARRDNFWPAFFRLVESIITFASMASNLPSPR